MTLKPHFPSVQPILVSFFLFPVPDITTQYSSCTRGDVRLMGGVSPSEGRVEVCINRAWGSVCQNDWDEQDASVVCQQLGHRKDGIQHTYM